METGRFIKKRGLKMKIAMPHMEGSVNAHFGSSREFIVFEAENGKITGKKVLTNEVLHNHGGLASMLKAEGVSVVITGGIGMPMAQALFSEGFTVIKGVAGKAEQVAEDFLKGVLVSGPVNCNCGGDHGHDH